MQAADSYFVDFRDVWLAYNDELRAQNQFAVEAIHLQVDGLHRKLVLGAQLIVVGEPDIAEVHKIGIGSLHGRSFLFLNENVC